MESECRRLWPRVDPGPLISLLRGHGEAVPGVEETVAQAFSYPAEEAAAAASLLMATVGAVLPAVQARERSAVMQALDVLVRAGGDPSPVFTLLTQALRDASTQRSALTILRAAALRGWSLLPIEEPLAGMEEAGSGRDSMGSVQRLLRMQQAGYLSAITDLSVVYTAQRPMGTLLEGMGLVEELFVTGAQEDLELARATLADLVRAGKDFFAIWSAQVPVLRRHLRAQDAGLRERAACALGKIKYAVDKSSELDEEEAAREALPALTELLPELAKILGDETSASPAAADTIRTVAALGCSMEAVEGALEAAMDDPRVDVRRACSEALSIHRVRTKKEAPLPRGFSYRRAYAQSDTPLPSRRSPMTCQLCGEQAVDVIHDWNDGAQFYSLSITELRCSACGVYHVEEFRAPG